MKIRPRVSPRPPWALGEVLGIEQPFVGPERAVKPHRMIEAGRHHALVEQRAAVARHRRVQQREVRRIGQRTHVQRRIVGQFRGGPDPDIDAAVLDLLAEIAADLDRAQLDRALGLVIVTDKSRHVAEHLVLCHLLRGELFRRRHVRHLVLVVERALLFDVKRHHDRKDRVAVLDRSDPAGRVAFAVAQPLDFIDDWNLRIARKDEITVQRMRQPAFDGAACRHHRLPDHLTAEHPLPAGFRAVAAKHVHLDRLEIEDGNQVTQAFGHGSAFGSWQEGGTAVIPGRASSREPGI